MSEYLFQIDASILKMWNADKDNEKLEGEILEICEKPYSLKGIDYVLDIINLY